MSRKRVTFPCGELSLEGVIYAPEGGTGQAVVVCHPHPLHGGDMYNNVVIEVCRELEARGITSLRFNFRGVGESEGSHGQGIGEQADLRAALSFLEGLAEIDKDRLGVAGYSFGAGVCTGVSVDDDRVKAFAAISLPLRMANVASLQTCAKPKLFILGSDDSFIPAAELQRLVETLPDPKQCIIVRNADHFWFDGAADVGTQSAEFFTNAL